ncbi:MAG TPA: efflux RND transporter periplasmic adaptor subunit [Longimicrobiales bacterium]
MKAHVAFLASASALLIACGQRIEAESTKASGAAAPAAAAPAPSFTTVDPEPASTAFKTTLYSEHDADVTARTEGVIRTVTVELGDRVAEGAVLALLEDEREMAALQSAQAAAELARSERVRASALRTSEMITQAELDAAVYKEKAAEAAVRTAQVELGYTRVRAPFSGRVAQRSVRVGQTVKQSDPLFRVTASAPLRAALRVPERELGALTIGGTVSLLAENGSSVTGKVLRISPTVDPASGTIEVLVDVPQPRGLRPGSAVTLLLGTTELVKAAQ